MSKEHTSDGRSFLSLAARLWQTRGRLAAVAALTLALAGAAASAPSAAWSQAQSQDRPKIADEVEGPVKNGGTKKESPKRPATPNRRQQTQRRSQPPPEIEVTFTTRGPETKISLILGSSTRQKYLGESKPGKPLTKSLAPGTHDIIASAVGFERKSQKIEVRPDNTTFEVQLGAAIPPPDVAEKAPPETAPTPPADDTADDVTADKALSEADEAIKQSLNAKGANGVSKDEWQRVLSRLNAALEKEPGNSQLKARTFVAQGQLALMEDDVTGPVKAINAFKKAVVEDSKLAAAHYGLGIAYLRTNQPDQALIVCERASKESPQLGPAFLCMGDALTRQGKKKEAARYYKLAKDLGGAPPSVALADARKLKGKKRWGPAVEAFEEIEKSNPSAELSIDIGDCYVELNLTSKALDAYRKATKQDPKSALAFYKYGDVLFKLEKYAEASEAFETSLALDLSGPTKTIDRKRAREMANKAAELANKPAK